MLERINKAIRARVDDDARGELQNDDEGFTLVELLIVVVVLGILAAVTVFGLSGTTSTSYKAACNADARSVEVAVEAYRANNPPNFPTTYDQLINGPGGDGTVYLRTKPNSPKYTINIGANGAVLVANTGPNTAGGANYDDGVNGVGGATNPCLALP